jgi:hypothetical protein
MYTTGSHRGVWGKRARFIARRLSVQQADGYQLTWT